jgi:hypothetical protein
MMKKLMFSLIAVCFLALTCQQPVAAESTLATSFPDTLCLPGVYTKDVPNCSLFGPAAYLTERASIYDLIGSQAMRYPIISESFGETEVNYFRANDDNNVFFYSYESALANSGAAGSLYEGYTFAAYTKMVETSGKRYFQLSDGRWMRGSSVAYFAAPNRFLGVLPTEQPVRKFGWVLKDTPTLKEAGYYAPKTGNVIQRYSLVEVFEEQRIGLSDWYMLAPDEWVHMTQVALVYPMEQPPKGVTNGRWIEINIFEQTLTAYENNKMIFATLITSGSSRTFTRPGLFKIHEKLETTSMAGELGKDDAYYLMDVPWAMYFDERRGLHAEFWHDHLGYKSSHGCVNMSFPDADWMFQWANMGEWVYAWDPSGQTPTDSKLFTQHLDDS